tara:strand:+ start:476 stop:703 length:228 start_codon:yes stop_codon:yes gene_type:complete
MVSLSDEKVHVDEVDEQADCTKDLLPLLQRRYMFSWYVFHAQKDWVIIFEAVSSQTFCEVKIKNDANLLYNVSWQ